MFNVKKKLQTYGIIFLISIIFFVQPVLAITASSDNYSTSTFGTGMATADPSSVNHESTVLSASGGTTRNAESDNYRVNIGFFENTTYYKTVSITSYSISPSSAVIGSTISLYISALNPQSVWAVISRPDGFDTTFDLSNNDYASYIPPVVGTYTVTFYANSSTGAITSVIDSFQITAQATTPPSGGESSGRGGTTTIIKKCTYNWDCTPWSVCSEGKQTRICKNIGACEGNESKPIEEMDCSESLFNISLKLKDIELTENRSLKFGIDLSEKIGVEKIDTHIKYSIINKEGYEIFNQIETKAIQKELSYEKEIREIKLVDGDYTLRVDIFHRNLQRAFAEQKIKISNGKVESEGSISNIQKIIGVLNNYKLFIITITIITIITIPFSRRLFLFIRGHHRERFGKVKKGKRKYLAYSLIALLIVAFLALILKINITGRAINNLSSYNWKLILIPFIILIFITLLIVLRRRLISICQEIIRILFEIIHKNKKYPINSIKGLIGKKVYSESGDYVGEIKDIILGENKIDSLKIELDKKYKFKAKGIVINWNQIVNCGEIVIIKK